MAINFKTPDIKELQPRLLVLGVGGAGGNAINEMIDNGLHGVEFVAVNTDAQDLKHSKAKAKIQIGLNLTKGLGAGAKIDIGQAAADESLNDIVNVLQGANMVFIAAGMGGGTGTGAAPAIAKIAKETNALTIGIVTKPFAFEGPIRKKRALEGIKDMKRNCDTLLVIPNEILLEIASEDTTVSESFMLADSVLNQATKGISDLINKPGLINLDFADVKTVMHNMGDAIMGTGIARGEERAILAAQEAINSPLLQDANIKGAKGLLVNISGPQDMTIHELNDASSIIYEEAGENANVILGCVVDNNLTDEVHITVIATGLNDDEYPKFFEYENNEKYNMNNINSANTQIENNKIEDSKESEDKDNALQNKEKKQENKENITTFGDDLDIPTFLRNRNS